MKKVLICFPLTVLLLLSVLISCSGNKSQVNTEDTVTENDISFNQNAIYSLVRSENASKDLVASITAFKNTIEEDFGVKLDLKTDWVKDGKYDSDTKEILIGDTKYSESEEVKSTVASDGFAIVKKGNKIVIIGCNDEYTSFALTYFLKKSLSYNAERGALMYSGQETNYSRAEAIQSLKICGTPVSDYSIVYKSGDAEAKEYAIKAQQNLKSMLSAELPIKESTAVGDKNIVFSFSGLPSYTAADYMHYDIHVENNDLIVSTGGYYSLERLLMNLADTVFQNGVFDIEEGFSSSGNYFDAANYPIAKDADLRIISANVLADLSGWGGESINWKYRAEIFAGNMDFYDADVVGIQECSPSWLEFLQNGFNSPLKLLGKPSQNTFTYVLYNAERLEVLEYGYHDFSVKNNLRARGIAYGVFKDKESGKTFAFGSTHWNGGDNDDCKKQVNEAAKVLNDLKVKYNCSIYCTGDFNSNENTSVYKLFMQLTDMEDTMYTTTNRTNKLPSWHELGVENFSTLSCDHIFASKGVKCVKYRTLVENSQIYASDHSWLAADIILP